MSGPSLGVMAWRNLWRNRRRTFVTLSSIAFGVTLAVLFTGLGDASWPKMIDLAARMGGGHVTIQHPEYFDTPSPKRSVRGVGALRDLALGDPAVRRAVGRISGHALLATAKNSYGAFFAAFDPGLEDATTLAFLDSVREGEMLAGRSGNGIVLGARLAHNLGLSLGKKVVYTMTDRSGEIVTGLARVKGILRTGADSVDAALCLLPIDTVRELLGYEEDEATLLAVFVHDQREAAAVAGRLNAALGERAVALTWQETQPELAGFISMKIGGTVFFELIILVLAAAGIFNTLLVTAMERLREFGILMAIGFSPGRLFLLVMWESLWLALVGVASSVPIAAVPYYLMATKGIDLSAMVGKGGADVAGITIDPIMKVAIYPEHALQIAAVVALATLASGIFPAWRAGRVVPVESIRLV